MASVSEILLSQGQRGADAIRKMGDIRARMYGDLGNIASGAVQQYAQEKQQAPIREQEAEARALQLQGLKDDAAGRKADARATGQASAIQALSLVKDANGVDTFDREMLKREFTAAGIADRLPAVLKELDASDLAALNLKKAREEYGKQGLTSLLNTADASGGTPQALKYAAEKGVANGFFSQEEADQVLGYVGDDPAKAREVLDKLRGVKAPDLIQRDPTKDLVDPRTPTKPLLEGKPEEKPDTRSLQLQANDALKRGDTQEYSRIRKVIKETSESGRAPVINVSTGAQEIEAPADPESQDLMSQAGLSYNAFLALTGRMSLLPRDRVTRERASREVQDWARSKGMDVSTLGSQYKALNEVLESNIQRYNRTQMAEGEIAADVENLLTAVKESGLGDARAINAAQQWLKGELNDPNAAQYAFFLNQLTNDIALYNAASQGRAPLEADLADAKNVVKRGIAAGSLQGMQKAITASVEKMGTVLEGGVNRARQKVWELFGVGDKYKPKTNKGGGGKSTPDPLGIRK